MLGHILPYPVVYVYTTGWKYLSGSQGKEIIENNKYASLTFLWSFLPFLTPYLPSLLYKITASLILFCSGREIERYYPKSLEGRQWNVLRKVVVWEKGLYLN